MEKTAKVIECKFDKSWNPPTGGTLYVHNLKLSNGESGVIYHKQNMPGEILEGAEITYSINEKGKISISQKNNQQQSYTKKPQVNSRQGIDIIGYSFSYAKDLIIAKINNGEKIKNISEELIKTAEPIFNKMNELRDKVK